MKKYTAVFFILVAMLIVSSVGKFPAPKAQAALPKLVGGEPGNGFGGFITAATPCICADIGVLISVAGPFGGDFLISFTDPPRIKLGAFTMVGGPVLGATEGGRTCGTRIDDGCRGKRSATRVKYLAGIL